MSYFNLLILQCVSPMKKGITLLHNQSTVIKFRDLNIYSTFIYCPHFSLVNCPADDNTLVSEKFHYVLTSFSE